MKQRRRQIFALVALAALIAWAAVSFSQDVSLNEEMVAAAWSAYNAKDYEEAISKAGGCIDEFEAAAKREQEKLAAAGTPEPPDEKVVGSERDEIGAGWP